MNQTALAALWRLFTATHRVRVEVLREVANVQRLTGPVQLRPMWSDVYKACADGVITPAERRAVRKRTVQALRLAGRSFWADLLTLAG